MLKQTYHQFKPKKLPCWFTIFMIWCLLSVICPNRKAVNTISFILNTALIVLLSFAALLFCLVL